MMVWLPDGEKKFQYMFIRFDMIHEREKIATITQYVAWMERHYSMLAKPLAACYLPICLQ